ncbi:hypothetical protein AXE89_03505 [Staphylococcus aureus]|uniref:DUF2316 family protein n=1 Tax=Staphylococcus aureus TaxID=1280 RepID=UPI00208DDD5F|nr:DUF2316 family protein [Staphylococcus aureus]MCO4456095.1 hypothetical protein [Staphylococcus aureus]
MSLNKEQRRITAEELQANFEESTLSVQMIAEKLNVTTEDVEKVFAMKTPLGIFSHQLQRFIHLVWDVRNVINDDIKESGQTPEPYTYLKGEKEDYWFLR